MDPNPGEFQQRICMVLPRANRADLWVIQEVPVTRLQAMEQIKNNQSQSLMISFNQTNDILADLGRFIEYKEGRILGLVVLYGLVVYEGL